MKDYELEFDNNCWEVIDHQPAEHDVGIMSAYDIIVNEGELKLKNIPLHFGEENLYDYLMEVFSEENIYLDNTAEVEIKEIKRFEDNSVIIEFKITKSEGEYKEW